MSSVATPSPADCYNFIFYIAQKNILSLKNIIQPYYRKQSQRIRRVFMAIIHRKTVETILLLGLLMAGCGYHFAGAGSLPGDIKSISVSMLENRTAETGVESIFTNDIIYEITRAKKVRLTSPDQADATLTGTIASIRTSTISRSGQHTSNEKRIIVTVALKLANQDGQTIWAAESISANEEYQVAADKQATEQNRRDAVAELSKRLAENIYNRLTSDF